mgnify:FL=1
MHINYFSGKSIKGLLIPLIIAIIIGIFNCSKTDKLSEDQYNRIQKDFTEPHDTNKIWCYYYWIGDDISKEGVTKDLKAMKEFGIGAVLIGNINPDEVDGPVPLFSDKWWEIMVHAVNEGHRLGIDIGFFNCPGWSQSGGPWVTAEKAMRHLVYSETHIDKAGKVRKQLPKPADKFQDAYVLAFKSTKAGHDELKNNNTRITSDPRVENSTNWLDGDPSTSALFSLARNNQYTINFRTDKAIDARSILLHPATQFKCNCKLLARINGEYQPVKSFIFDRSNTNVNVGPRTHGPVAISIPETTSDAFKLVCTDLVCNKSKAGFSEIEIKETAILERYVEKSLGKMHPTPTPTFDTYMWETQNKLTEEDMKITEVRNLSTMMNEEGILNWDAPEGNWTVLRVGMTPTGTKNAPAAPQGKGYEIDKMNEKLARFHFEQYIGEILERIPEENRSAFKYVIADSYEMGSQNWTDGFKKRFEAKYGYDPVKYLPVISGRIVESVEKSDRFLWDLRRAVADDIAYEYVGGLSKISNEHNLKLWLENYGHWGFPSEFLMYGGQSDLVSGEYWNEGELGNIECKSASSAAHMYGKPFVSAEAFTSSGQSYKRHPAMLKKRGDWSLTEGINNFVLHLYIHQPDDERIPGVNAWFGTEFNRHNTWFDQGEEWADYLRRCQHMLQRGKYVADVCYFIGEDAPKMTGKTDPELPQGYSYDFINAEVIKDRLSVDNGKFVLPNGMSFQLLVLPPDVDKMRPDLIRKIEQLVKDGGTVLGSRPQHSPSLENYPEADSRVKQIAQELWPENYDDGKLFNSYGKGHVIDGVGIQEALDFIKVPKDMEVAGDLPILWTHRSLPEMEIYFLTNQGDEEISFDPSFRVDGLKPQLWNAVNGEIRLLNEYSVHNGKATVPLKMKPAESMFIVFTNKENDNTRKGYESNFPEAEKLLKVENQWTVKFDNEEIGPSGTQEWETLKDWTSFEDDKIKYYSGTAIYKTNFEIDELPQNHNFFVDLGNVGVMASVKLNGKNLGGVWIDPFILPANGHLRVGENKLEVEVVNTWRNRMVKDQSLPEDEQYTWTVVNDVEPSEELMSSGLIGPVSVRMISKTSD